MCCHSVAYGMTRRMATPMHSSRSHGVVIRVYDDDGSLIETHKHGGEFKGW